MMKRIICALLTLALLCCMSSALAYQFNVSYDEYSFRAWEEGGHQYFAMARNGQEFAVFEDEQVLRVMDGGSVAYEAAFNQITPGMKSASVMLAADAVNCEELPFQCYYFTFMNLMEGWTVVATNRVLPLTAGNCRDNEMVDFSAAMDVAGSRYYLCKNWLIEVR